MLECKIKQLKLELENESIPSTIRNISQISEQDSSSVKVFEALKELNESNFVFTSNSLTNDQCSPAQ
jgi:hypothetical protein